jgi:hypothetical protein
MKIVEKIIGGTRVIEHIMEESDFASAQLVQQRLSTCSTCEFIVNNESCSKCSCLLQSRTKYVEMFCPEGKW